MSPQEAAELLDLLKEHHSIIPATHKAMSLAVAALEREAKAEPVAWAYVNPDGECEQIEWGPVFDDPHVTPLYASPPQNRPASQVRDIPEGWVMVPREATDKMLRAVFVAMNQTPAGEWKAMKAANLSPRAISDAKMAPRYRAMIASAPPAPESK